MKIRYNRKLKLYNMTLTEKEMDCLRDMVISHIEEYYSTDEYNNSPTVREVGDNLIISRLLEGKL